LSPKNQWLDNMNVLGIETSCDEVGVAIYGEPGGLKAHKLYTQIPIHAQYGGVVPELASRDHIQHVLPLIQRTLDDASFSQSDIHGIAYTAGPGLLGSLLVGACVARSLAYAWQMPAVGVHHLEGHLLAPMLETDKPSFPFLALLVSGGHSSLIKVAEFGSYEIIGESIDDAVGEAFDKTARLLGLPYPGGAALAALAEYGNEDCFELPRPMIHHPTLDMSFSGLKTAVVILLQKHPNPSEQERADIAASFQKAAIETLLAKCEKALVATGLKQLVVAGGVSANVYLRQRLQQLDVRCFFPRKEFCTDNGAMIAYAGYERLKRGFQQDLSIDIKARWDLADSTQAQPNLRD